MVRDGMSIGLLPSLPGEAGQVGKALCLIDETWAEHARSIYVQRSLACSINRLPDIDEAEAGRRASVGRALLARFDTLGSWGLDPEIALTVAVARDRASTWAQADKWYWHAFDVLGVGFFGMFAPTGYAGGVLLDIVKGVLAGFSFDERGDLDRYHGMVADYARLLGQMRDRTAGQAERGIRMPDAQRHGAITLLRNTRASVEMAFRIDASRIARFDTNDYRGKVNKTLDRTVLPAFDGFIADLEQAEPVGPDRFHGLGDQPGGAPIYDALVRHNTTLNRDPEAIHRYGLERMSDVRERIGALLAESRFTGSASDYLRATAANPDWRADGPDELKGVFERYIKRIGPHLDAVFGYRPAAGHAVAPMPAMLEASMTYGFFSPPGPAQPNGTFYFNSRNLSAAPLTNVAALTYHELVPGHHFHAATQQGNTALPLLRQHNFVPAYAEGWAEYAATLAGELGMYVAPQERFGRLQMEAFLTSRLVVDTGLNALGWPLEKARDYMRAHALIPETEIVSETLRYDSDLPGQALAYKCGDDFIMALRERARTALGSQFLLSDFHDAVLEPGALPLPLLAEQVARQLARGDAAIEQVIGAKA